MAGSDLTPRLVSGLILAIVGLSALIAGGWYFAALCGFVAGMLTFELARLVVNREGNFWPAFTGAGVCIGFIAVWALASASAVSQPSGYLLIILIALAPACFMRGERFVFGAFGTAVLVATYALLEARIAYGIPLASWLLLVVVVTDISGYFAGKAIGGPQLAPRISPGKRWSGTCAGWIAALLVSIPFAGHLGYWVLWAGVFLSVSSQLGDLAESWLKRRAKVKDSSELIPGHGGFLDRFDGMVAASAGFCILDQASLVPVSMAAW